MTALLKNLCSGAVPSCAIVAAHPDDEVIGAGAQLPRWKNLSLIYVTDGAPRNAADATAAGFPKRTDYARARRQEVEAALQLVQSARCCEQSQHNLTDDSRPNRTKNATGSIFHLDFVDQEAAFHLVELACSLAECLLRLQPAVVITHPYEGGHPDHDSAAFGVHAACALLRAWHGEAPQIVEMTSYHNRAGQIATGEFLPCGQSTVQLDLTPDQRDLKRRLFKCFVTQSRVLELFDVKRECFREAPAYDFTKAPHQGPLYYERFDWGVTGEHWRHLAGIATAKLDPNLHFSRPIRHLSLVTRISLAANLCNRMRI